jgi:hypothetical protein
MATAGITPARITRFLKQENLRFHRKRRRGTDVTAFMIGFRMEHYTNPRMEAPNRIALLLLLSDAGQMCQIVAPQAYSLSDAVNPDAFRRAMLLIQNQVPVLKFSEMGDEVRATVDSLHRDRPIGYETFRAYLYMLPVCLDHYHARLQRVLATGQFDAADFIPGDEPPRFDLSGNMDAHWPK